MKPAKNSMVFGVPGPADFGLVPSRASVWVANPTIVSTLPWKGGQHWESRPPRERFMN
jgi:hypothetical protein